MSWELTPSRSWSLVKYVDLRHNPVRTIIDSDLLVYLYREQRLLTIMHRAHVVEKIYLYGSQLTVLYRKAAVVFSVNIAPSQVTKFRIRLSGVADRITFCLAVSEFVEVRESPASPNGSQTQFSSGSSSYPEYHNLSQSSLSQSSVMSLRETKCTSLTTFPRTSFEMDGRNTYPTSSSYQGSSEDMFSRSSQGYSVDALSSRSSPIPYVFCEKPAVKDADTQTDPMDICQATPEQIEAFLTELLKDPSFQSLVKKMRKVLPNVNRSNG
ncbi:unnamed protein product [Haemonchus placei]|uniref:GRAM domain-containing protein n=1 Tax=Haemonchus placei TaxID=6290 RepID=A0A0N4VTD9_HAEPC|nr:unnamed protein product [Haemonchus placei]